MQKSTFIIIAVIVVVVWIVALMPKSTPSDDTTGQNAPTVGTTNDGSAPTEDTAGTDWNQEDAEGTVPAPTPAPVDAPGYKPYSEDAVNEALDADKIVVLFFFAGWSPASVVLNGNIEANVKAIPEDLVIFKVDFDNEEALKTKYNVSEDATVVAIDSNLNKLSEKTGVTDIPTILELIGQ